VRGNGNFRYFDEAFQILRFPSTHSLVAKPQHHFKHDEVLSTRDPLRFFARIRHQDLIARAISSVEDIAAAQTRRRIDRDHDILCSPDCKRLRVRSRLDMGQLLALKQTVLGVTDCSAEPDVG
jgi:hypothetical protein